MKKHLLIAAIALVIAAPAAAQTAPALQHQGHAQHGQGTEHSRHGQPQSGQHGRHQGGQHQGHAMGDCCADRNGNGRMDCCENMAEGQSCCAEHQPARPAQPQPGANR